jgi:hypothetical protein
MSDPFLALIEQARHCAECTLSASSKTQVILCFDDGYAASCVKIARLFEKHGLRAVFAVLSGLAKWENAVLGDWELWNQLQNDGHFIHPHSHKHEKLYKKHLVDAVACVKPCFETFAAQLSRFFPTRTCFHYPYNGDNKELTEWLIKTMGVNCVRMEAPDKSGNGYNGRDNVSRGILYCTTNRCLGEPKALVERTKREQPYAWVIALHGVDGEGWGSTPSEKLEQLVECVIGEPAFECLNRVAE